jgi:hypothetical protein
MAFADEPAPAAQAAAAAAAPSASAVTTVTSTTVTTTTPAADAALSDIEAKKAAAAERIKKSGLGGYKPEVHGGVTKYCRVEQKIGTRFTEKECRSYEQLMADQQTGRDYTEQLQKMGVQPRQ